MFYILKAFSHPVFLLTFCAPKCFEAKYMHFMDGKINMKWEWWSEGGEDPRLEKAKCFHLTRIVIELD